MSFLEMTKRYLARQETARIVCGHSVKRVIWETEKVVVFQDLAGHFRRYLRENSKIESAVIIASAKSG